MNRFADRAAELIVATLLSGPAVVYGSAAALVVLLAAGIGWPWALGLLAAGNVAVAVWWGVHLLDKEAVVIGLIGCSAQKLDRPAPARKLYCSPLFRKSLAYAESRCERVYVLSGELGLVNLAAVIEPYDRRLRRDGRETWARDVAAALLKDHGHEVDYLLLAGRDYTAPLMAALRASDELRGDRWRGVPIDRILTPLDGMQIGQRLRWLTQQARCAEAA